MREFHFPMTSSSRNQISKLPVTDELKVVMRNFEISSLLKVSFKRIMTCSISHLTRS